MSDSRRPLTVCISTHEMGGKGAGFLAHSLGILTRQTFKDFDVVVSDQSTDNAIQEVCEQYADKLDIQYYRERTGKRASSVNINNAIRHAKGELIKILFLDDYLYHDRALEDIVDAFGPKDHWLVTACTHTQDGETYYRPFQPRLDPDRILFKNTISSPSVVTIRNDAPLLFDEELIWWMDLDYYKRAYTRFGMPVFVREINVVNREGKHQVTNTTATEARREREWRYVVKKFHLPHSSQLILNYQLRRYRRQLKSFLVGLGVMRP